MIFVASMHVPAKSCFFYLISLPLLLILCLNCGCLNLKTASHTASKDTFLTDKSNMDASPLQTSNVPYAPNKPIAPQHKVLPRTLPVVPDSIKDKIYDEVAYAVRYYYYQANGIPVKINSTNRSLESLFSSLDDMSQMVGPTPKSSTGTLAAFGLRIRRDGDTVQIMDVLPRTPAEAAGLHELDTIIDVDGIPLEQKGIEEIVGLLRGVKGSSSTLTVQSEGFPARRITMSRAEVNYAAFRASNITSEGIGYIAVREFTPDLPTRFFSEIIRMQEAQLKLLILDVRNCHGGLLGAVLDIARHFLSKNQYVGFAKANINQSYGAAEDGPYTFPVIVLVNHATASGAEILASALQENGVAKVIGFRTYGLGSIQSVIPLSDDYGLRLTTAYWYTPKMFPLDKYGVEPDVILKEDVSPAQTWPNQHLELGKNISLDGISEDKVLLEALDYARWVLKFGKGVAVPSSYIPQS